MTLIRRFVSMLLWSAAFLLGLGAIAVVLFANYSGLVTGFALSGFDVTPLGEHALTGWLFDAFGLGEATQADLYAAAVALGVMFGTLLVFHLLFRAFRLVADQREYARAGDVQRERMARAALTFTLFVLGAIIPGFSAAVYMDFVYYRFRAIAGALGIDGPEDVLQLANWDGLVRQIGDSFPLQLAGAGAFGYIGITAVLSVAIEWIAVRSQDSWRAFEAEVAALFEQRAAAQVSVGGAEQVPSPEEQGAAPTVVAEPVGVPAEEHAPAWKEQDAAPASATTTTVSGSAGAAEPLTDAPRAEATPVEGIRSTGAAEPVTRVVTSPPGREEVEWAVLGGAPGERVKLSVALNHPDRYVVDSEHHRVWNREYYDTLHERSVTERAGATA